MRTKAKNGKGKVRKIKIKENKRLRAQKCAFVRTKAKGIKE